MINVNNPHCCLTFDLSVRFNLDSFPLLHPFLFSLQLILVLKPKIFYILLHPISSAVGIQPKSSIPVSLNLECLEAIGLYCLHEKNISETKLENIMILKLEKKVMTCGSILLESSVTSKDFISIIQCYRKCISNMLLVIIFPVLQNN